MLLFFGSFGAILCVYATAKGQTLDNDALDRAAEKAVRRLVSIEDVVIALAGQCDGARKRDGRGFNRADAQEGGRLAALKSAGVPWSVDDARKAIEIASKYASQAGVTLGDGRESKAAGIEAALRNGKVQLADEPIEDQPQYNYACLSPGGKRVYLWRLTWVENLTELITDLRDVCRENPHGRRRCFMDAKVTAELTLNGKRRRVDRTEIDLNGSTRAGIVEVCKKHGFVLEPAIETPVDDEIDGLRRYEKAAWLHTGSRDGEKGTWAVFDLAQKDPAFSAAVKAEMKGQFDCDPQDDWNWFLKWTPETVQRVRRLASVHRFAVSDDIRHARL